MARITAVLDDSRARARIASLDASAGNARPLYAAIGRVLVNRIRLAFRIGIDPFGSPWAALKMRKGQPLRDTGRLERSITSRPDGSGVTVGTNLKYARVHQYGATITPTKARRLVFPGPGGRMIFAKKVTIPARPFLPLRRDAAAVELPPDWSAAVTQALRRYFVTAANKAAA
jgi:phage virion morphogenesis protein